MSISAVINTWNEERNIKRCIDSLASWVDEIVVVDMNSEDSTREIARKLGASVYTHPHTGFVEPARNFAIEKATHEWIVIVDADEVIPDILASKLKNLANTSHGKSFFRIPRKNMIFGRWIQHARWWPDYQIRFFKKGMVNWIQEIHSIPVTQGEGVNIEEKADNAIVHYNYESISQFLHRMDRYTNIQAREIYNDGIKPKLHDYIKKPFNEFVSRFIAGEGYKDGLHGFALSMLQAFSETLVLLKVWEMYKFEEHNISIKDIENSHLYYNNVINYWIKEEKIKREPNQFRKVITKIIS